MAIFGFILDVIPHSFPTSVTALRHGIWLTDPTPDGPKRDFKLVGAFAFLAAFFLLIAVFKPEFGRTGGLSRRTLRMGYLALVALALIGGLLFALDGFGLIRLDQISV